MTKKTTLFIIAIAVLLLASGAVALLIHMNKKASEEAAITPQYTTVLPAGKSIESLGGWKRVSPAEKAPVYAYFDALDGIAISVSEQPLPTANGQDVNAQILDIAKNFNATTPLNNDGLDAYIGTSSVGPQSIILSKKGVLVLIKSKEKVDDKTWVSYINSLN